MPRPGHSALGIIKPGSGPSQVLGENGTVWYMTAHAFPAGGLSLLSVQSLASTPEGGIMRNLKVALIGLCVFLGSFLSRLGLQKTYYSCCLEVGGEGQALSFSFKYWSVCCADTWAGLSTLPGTG